MPSIAENISAMIGKLSEALDTAREAQVDCSKLNPYLPKLIHVAKLSLEVDVLVSETEALARKQSKRLRTENGD